MERSTSALAYNGANEKGGTIVESAVTQFTCFPSYGISWSQSKDTFRRAGTLHA
jgi:hypothetical protein